MEQTAEHLRIVLPFDLCRADVETIIKRAARELGIVGGQCRQVGSEFVGAAGAWIWRFEIRGLPVDVIRTVGQTVLAVPPVELEGDTGHPWIFVESLRLAIGRRHKFLAPVVPYPEPEEAPCEVSPRKRLARWRGSFGRWVAKAKRRGG